MDRGRKPARDTGSLNTVKLPDWALAVIQNFQALQTGKVTIELELYNGGITKLEIGGVERHKPPVTTQQK